MEKITDEEKNKSLHDLKKVLINYLYSKIIDNKELDIYDVFLLRMLFIEK